MTMRSGLHEVVDGGAFLEEFGVGDDGEGWWRGAGRNAARAAVPARMPAATLSAVPTGTVDLLTTTLEAGHVPADALRPRPARIAYRRCRLRRAACRRR